MPRWGVCCTNNPFVAGGGRALRRWERAAYLAFGASDPHVRLWAAVFGQAVSDARRPRQQEQWADTIEWLIDDGETVGSFRFVCEVLGLDYPTQIRKDILKDIGVWQLK